MKKLILIVLLLSLAAAGYGASGPNGGPPPEALSAAREPLGVSKGTPPDAGSEEEASSLPEGLPVALASAEDIDGSGGYLLLGEISEEDIALYCDNAEERNQAYIRYGEHFQAFSQNAWADPAVLPELSWSDWDGANELSVRYLRREGTYFDGEAYSPGLVYEQVVYLWDGEQWEDVHFSSSGPVQARAPS